MKFRKKPVVIDAIQYTGSGESFEECADFCAYLFAEDKPDRTFIHTLEGDMLVSVNDWIIKGAQGEFYPIKPDIFEQTYEVI